MNTTTKETMTRSVITIAANKSMTEAYRLMQANNIRHLPVVDERNAVVGILSDRDLQRAMKVTQLNNFQQNVTLDAGLLVENYMSWPVYVVSESTSIKRVAEEMLTQKVSAFLVQDNLGQMKGIITTDDLLKLFLNSETTPVDLPLQSISHYFMGPEIA